MFKWEGTLLKIVVDQRKLTVELLLNHKNELPILKFFLLFIDKVNYSIARIKLYKN